MKIDSTDRTIKSILGSYYFKIPRFQRPYSWDNENISEFWNDIVIDGGTDYFIGSMVTYKGKDDTYGVVDGQQRLTTITMVLCVLRDAFIGVDQDDLAKGVHQLIERPNIDNKQQYILSTESSYPYFQEHILSFSAPEIKIDIGDEEQKIASSFKLITSLVKKTMDSIKFDPTISEESAVEKIKSKLVEIRNSILSLKLIFVELDNEDDACTIFETLNTRGKDLNVTDLVKNLLFKFLKTKNVKVDTPKIQWERVLETIGGSSADIKTDDFLHHYWLSKHDYVTIKKLFKQIKKTIKKKDAKDFLDTLENDSKTYREIHETSFKRWNIEEENIKNALNAFQIFRIKQQIPMVLSVMRDYRSKLITKKQVEKILVGIENFHFIFTAITSQRSSGGISQMYASSARRLGEADGKDNKNIIINELYSKLREKIPTYQEFEANFKEFNFTNNVTKQKKLIKYILSKIHAEQNQGNSFNYQLMTIEHIAPQSNSEFEIMDDFIGEIGNLILIPSDLNNKLGTKSFDQKKKILEEKNVSLDQVITDADKWTEEEIQSRTKFLANYAFNTVWVP